MFGLFSICTGCGETASFFLRKIKKYIASRTSPIAKETAAAPVPCSFATIPATMKLAASAPIISPVRDMSALYWDTSALPNTGTDLPIMIRSLWP